MNQVGTHHLRIKGKANNWQEIYSYFTVTIYHECSDLEINPTEVNTTSSYDIRSRIPLLIGVTSGWTESKNGTCGVGFNFSLSLSLSNEDGVSPPNIFSLVDEDIILSTMNASMV